MNEKDENPQGIQLASPCDHFVQFFEDDAFLTKSVAAFVEAAVVEESSAIVIATPEHRTGIADHLSKKGQDVDNLAAQGRFLAVDAAETLAAFMVDGLPDACLFQRTIGELIDRLQPSSKKVHAFGEMVALLAASGNVAGVTRLEELWNNFLSGNSISLFCAYSMNLFEDPESAVLFAKVCAAHDHVLPAESFHSASQSREDELRAIAALQQKARTLEAEVRERRKFEDALREQTRTLQILHGIASKLVHERDLSTIVQTVTDAGKELSGAAFGAFFYNLVNETGESYTLYTLSGALRSDFEKFPMPRNTAIFAPTFEGSGVERIGDVLKDPRYGQSAPYFGMPKGHLPVRSYLAVPVISRTGDVLGGLFFGHPEPDVFSEIAEELLVTLAAQAAVAIDNSKLDADLKRELAASRESYVASSRLATIVESSDDAIVSKNLDGIITSWNAGAQRIFGYTPEEAIGMPVTMLIPSDHDDEEPEIISRIRRGERVDHYETVRLRKDGTRIDISLCVSPIRDAQGTVVGASKISRDISARRRDEKALEAARLELAKSRDELEARVEERTRDLREAVAQMEEFSYTVSHDLRAPLRSMRTYSVALMEDFGDLLSSEPQARHYVERIAANSAKLDKMVLDVLAFGRIARDKITLQRVSLSELVADIVNYYPSWQPPSIDLEIGPLSDVIGHEPSLTQIVSNLLGNAIKFAKEGQTPKVRIWTERHDNMVRLWVEDEGIGIEPQYQDRLFRIFERIHPNQGYEGTGIGLAIVRKAAERMGGQTGVESDGISGSRFWVDLVGPEENL